MRVPQTRPVPLSSSRPSILVWRIVRALRTSVARGPDRDAIHPPDPHSPGGRIRSQFPALRGARGFLGCAQRNREALQLRRRPRTHSCLCLIRRSTASQRVLRIADRHNSGTFPDPCNLQFVIGKTTGCPNRTGTIRGRPDFTHAIRAPNPLQDRRFDRETIMNSDWRN